MPSDSLSLLVFGAHPDDIEFGCGGIVAAETARGAAVHFVVGSRGESGTNGDPATRTAEAERAAQILGATIEFADLGGDAHFEHRSAHVIRLAGVIRRVRPTTVLAPSLVENQHPDHAILGRLVRDATRVARYGGVAELQAVGPHAIGQLFYYAVSADAEPRDLAPVLIDLSAPDVVSTWTLAMEAHASQLRTRNYVDLQLARARLHGVRIGAEHALPLFPNDPLVFDSLGQLGRAARRF